jgi:hypothetical protein
MKTSSVHLERRDFIYLFSKFIPRASYQRRSIKNVSHFLTSLLHRSSGVTPFKGHYLSQPLWSCLSSNIPISRSWKIGEPRVRSIVRATTSRTEIDCDIIHFLSRKAASRVVISYKRSFPVMTTQRIEENALGTHVWRLVAWNLGGWDVFWAMLRWLTADRGSLVLVDKLPIVFVVDDSKA